MSVQEWAIVVGVAMSAVLALAPWMFMVHAKLAVLANEMTAIGRKMDKASETHEKLWSIHARHEARLETQQLQIGQISERLRDLFE